ncbi:MAG: DUF1934 domain-containing protein [Clostridia bacterium]|nr:DUF1934 domain-containing protein [Clostridia bacterium]
MLGKIKKATIKMRSIVDGVSMQSVYRGEYAMNGASHNIVYTDYTGNTVTKNGIEANAAAMLLHRAGGFEYDMYFDPGSDTVTKYDAFAVKGAFILHTYEYRVKDMENGLRVFVKYGLNDGSGEEEIRCEQTITVMWEEAA